MSPSYVVTDRTTLADVAIKVDDGQILVETGASGASAEPIVLDGGDGVTYWKIFVDDGQIGVESTATVQNDDIQIDDTTTDVTWRLIVNNGNLGIETVESAAAGGILPWIRRRRR